MKTRIDEFLRLHPAPDKFEELCCLFALGDLSAEEVAFMREHQKQCQQCQELISEFERIMVFDLPAAAVLRNQNGETELNESSEERKLLAEVLERARENKERNRSHVFATLPNSAALSIPWWEWARHRARPLVAPTGWAVAAMLLFEVLGSNRRPAHPVQPQAAIVVAPQEAPSSAEMQARALRAEAARDEATTKLRDSEARSRYTLSELSRITEQYKNLDSTYAELKNLLTQEQVQLGQRTSELELTRNNLQQEASVRDTLQSQLTAVLAQLEKQRTEAAHAQEVADREPAALAVEDKAVDPSEAKEILGARDLHIVDVYDVDKTGKSARVYGRIYYVNHHLLVFYAFDLARAEKSRMSAAFQAWGFRQPHSTTAESLGLFYLDNASLNRWTLRVSDPEVLSRIDTLFVTVEPPGGSRFPKGRRLLMASLAGPANHP
jgi:ribosomal protein L17